MRKSRWILCLLALAISSFRAASAWQSNSSEQEVLSASQARREAANKRDMEVMSRYIADECLFSTDYGDLITKAQFVEGIRKLPFEYDHSANPREFVVRVFGNTAVLNFRVTVHEQFGDADIVSEQRRTETWLKQNSSWQLIAMQWDNMPVNFRKPASIDVKVLNDFVGEYHSRPGDDAEVLFVKEGKLMTQIGKDVTEYLPAGGDNFFLRDGDLATFTFSRDKQGKVVGYVYHRIDGQQIIFKKTK